MKKRKINLPLIEVVGISLVIHIMGLFVLGGIVIWSTSQSPEFEFEAPPAEQAVEVTLISLKPQVSKPKQSSHVTIAVQVPDMATLDMIDVPTVQNQAKVAFGNFGTGGLGFGGVGAGLDVGLESLFGSEKSSGSDLEGIFYDLKQDRRGKRTFPKYYDVVSDFVEGSWSKNVLKKYYAADRKLFASTFLIPHRRANEAPGAFQVADEVEPAQWLAHYKGQLVAPKSGKFRFWGFADDVLFVRINKKVVLDGSFKDKDYSDWETKEPELNRKYRIGNGTLAVGHWFSVNNGDTVDMEVLIGERPGGFFSTYLLIEEDGVDYPKVGNGQPILPMFKTRPLSDGIKQKLSTELSNATRGFIDLEGLVFGPKRASDKSG